MKSKIIPAQTGNGIINSSPNRKRNQNHFQPKQEMESKLIPAQTGNWTMNVCALICQLIADLQRGRTWNSLIIRSCLSFLSGGQSSTDKLVLQLVYIFIVSHAVRAGYKINSSPTSNWNWNWFQPKQGMELWKCTQIVKSNFISCLGWNIF